MITLESGEIGALKDFVNAVEIADLGNVHVELRLTEAKMLKGIVHKMFQALIANGLISRMGIGDNLDYIFTTIGEPSYPVYFTQYLLPDGRKRPMYINVDHETGSKANQLIGAGCHFDVEILSTGMISLTCECDEDMIGIQLSKNDPEIVDKTVLLINESYDKVFPKEVD